MDLLGSWLHWAINKPNPLVQIFYGMIACGGYYIYVKVVFLNYCPGPYLAGWHRYTGSLLMFVCYYSFYKACTVDPGVIEDRAQARVSQRRYAYDEVMFKLKNICPTCKIEKPARSKHCAVCDRCVEKFDHHCIWLNQCVGRKNYKWFLSFIFLHIWICLYGSVAGIAVFLGEKKKIDSQGVMFKNMRTGEQVKPTLGVHLRYFFLSQERHFGIVLIICILMFFVLSGFLIYHLRLAKSNQTTNESFKRHDFNMALKHEHKVLKDLIEECKNHEPKKGEDG